MRSLSIAIPALNEEERLRATVMEVLGLARTALDTFEITIVNDGSSDKTGEIADFIALHNAEVSVIHNPVPRGLGHVFSECTGRAKLEHFVLIPGDHAYYTEGLRPLFEAIGTVDIVVGTRTNQAKTRSPLRVFISRLYNQMMALLFGFRLEDFHGVIIFPVHPMRNLNLRLIGYTFQIETLIKLLRQKYTFVEVPVRLNKEDAGTSRSLRAQTFLDVVKILCHLLRSR